MTNAKYKWDGVVFAAIVLYKMEHDGNMPTYGEMEEMTGAVRSMIFQSIRRLCEEGRLCVVDKKVCVAEGLWTFTTYHYEGSRTSSAPATSLPDGVGEITTPSKTE